MSGNLTTGQPIGFGAFSVVCQAEYHAPSGASIPCALKIIDLDALPMNSLPLLRRETQLMSLSKHPNILRVLGTWVDGHKLYIALRLMRSGSVAHVMQYKWPGGVEEEVAKRILKDALEGLHYLHVNDFIHRDVKAANLLIDDDGTILLGDLGVAVALHDDETVSKRTTSNTTQKMTTRGKRKSFVGTPCWMAPEVIAQRHYDSKVDIWSLGITALELTQGRAPKSREPPHEILLKIVQDDPPTVDQEGGQFKYSKTFKDVIRSCLRKNPDERPTAADLLQMPFFRNVKTKDFLVHTFLNGLPSLVDRQERSRIPPPSSHISAVTWDFTQTGQGLPFDPFILKESLKNSIFETGDVARTVKTVDNSSTLLSYEKHERQRPRALKAITKAPFETSGRRITAKSFSLSDSLGFWKKLKRIKRNDCNDDQAYCTLT